MGCRVAGCGRGPPTGWSALALLVVTTSGGTGTGRSRPAGRALALTLLLGAAGAVIAFLATRQGWAQVRTTPPKPLPPSLVGVTGSALVPYAEALVVAGLASLAAVVATRNLWRRISGLVLALIGAGLAASAFTISASGAVAAAAASVGPASNPGAGSVTQGTGSGSSTIPDVVGASPHVAMTAAGWQALVVVGALAMIAAGVSVCWKPDRLAVMSSRYDAPTTAGQQQPTHPPADQDRSGQDGASNREGASLPADSAAMWEALSRGEDPTGGGRQAAGA
jgi:uncharacterized membrane protein (TIGR02234 family)